MQNNILKYTKVVTVILVFIFFISVNINYVSALSLIRDRASMGNLEKEFGRAAGYDTNTTGDLGSTVALIIEAFLGLLGVIFIILIILAGLKWMTAGGDEEKVRSARSSINRAIIGLIIIVSAYAITWFVFNYLPFGGGTGGGGTGPGNSYPL